MIFARNFFALCVIFLISAPAYALSNGVSYDIRAELDINQNAIIGTEFVTFTNNSGMELETLFLLVYPNAFRRGSNSNYLQELENNLGFGAQDEIYANLDDDAFIAINSIKSGDQALQYSTEDTILTVDLAVPLPDGQSIRLEIEFVYDLMQGRAADLMAFNHALRSAHRDGVYTVTLWYPRLAVLDETGWNIEPYSLLGEFYSDFADYDVQLTVPADFQIGASGRLQSETTENSKKTLYFVAEKIHDFAWVASSRYQIESLEWNGITVFGIYVDSFMSDLAESALSAIQFFSEQFGPYAYPTFTIAQVKVGGGMEYPGIVMIGQGTTREIVHEVGHQWWYAAVGNDEFDEAWLDEGFTTFAEERYMIDVRGVPEENSRSSFRFLEPGDVVLQPSSQYFSASTYGAAIYTKGAGILWMLRGYMGDDSFDQMLRDYYQQYRYQNSSTVKFSSFVENFTGEKLDWFFDQWLRTTKRLDYFVENVRSTPSSQSPSVSIALRRTGDAVMPVDVQVIPASSAEEIETFRWNAASERDEITIDGISTIEKIVIDPARSVLEENRSNNTYTPSFANLFNQLPMGLAIAAIWIGWRFILRAPFRA